MAAKRLSRSSSSGRDQRRRLSVAAARRARLDQVADERPDVAVAVATLLLVAPGRRPPQQPERVREDGAGGRGERSEERLVVERVRDHGEQAAQIVDLLLRPEAAPTDDVGIQPGVLERGLDGSHVGEGAHQDDDLRRVDSLVVHQLAGADRRACAPPRPSTPSSGRRAGAASAVSSASHPFLSSTVRRSSTAAPLAGSSSTNARQRLEPVQQAPADRVGRRDELGRGAEVPGQRQRLTVGLLSIREAAVLAAVDLDVRVAEAVDRLELVADQEEAGIRAAELLDQPELQAVRVLELVHHQVVELLAVPARAGGRSR